MLYNKGWSALGTAENSVVRKRSLELAATKHLNLHCLNTCREGEQHH